ncbi:AI-2E family transporter, partial [Pseudonocardia sp. S2-4]|nr:AI-2E family transporter [Pseudonocardia humida]
MRRRCAVSPSAPRRYFGITTVVGLATGFVAVVVPALLGIPAAALRGLLGFLTDYIPYLGFWIGLGPPALLALPVDGWPLLGTVVAVFLVVNFVLTSLVRLYYIGDAAGLSVGVTLVALVPWGVAARPGRRRPRDPAHPAAEGGAGRRRPHGRCGRRRCATRRGEFTSRGRGPVCRTRGCCPSTPTRSPRPRARRADPADHRHPRRSVGSAPPAAPSSRRVIEEEPVMTGTTTRPSAAYGVHSEVGTLRKVLVCAPGLAHTRLTPTNCDALLFDDV